MNTVVSCLQLNSLDNIGDNIAKIRSLVEKAAQDGAQLIALPENAFCMEAPGDRAHRTPYTLREHPGIVASCAMAKAHDCWILAGSVPSLAEGEEGAAVNRSVLIDPQGAIVKHYDKIHLFDVTLPGGETYAESARYAHGNAAALAAMPWGKLGLTICYDVRFAHLYRALAKAGASVIAVPAAFTAITGEAHWHVLLRARAIETGCFIIAPAQCGTHAGGRKTYGHSLIVDPWGRVLGDAGETEGVVTATLDLAMVDDVRTRIPSLRHDRAFII